jgi:hypothetical protein
MQNIIGIKDSSRKNNVVATGGTTSIVGNRTVHTFTANGTFTVSSGASNVRVLVIGGGGGGGFSHSGGGGAGGYQDTFVSLVPGTYAVTVGAGGSPGPNRPTNGSNGGNSSIGSLLTSLGGGGGGSEYAIGSNGGSAGGNAVNGGTPQQGTAGQGFPGGRGGGSFSGGGGGGASARGRDSSEDVATHAGYGGAGAFSNITGTSVQRAGGGGGGVYSTLVVPNWRYGSGGAGGGGNGSNGGDVPVTVTAGQVNTGSGGGGGGYPDTAGGQGGSGLVVVSYITPSRIPITATGGTKVTGPDNYTYHTFTGSGSLSISAIIFCRIKLEMKCS